MRATLVALLAVAAVTSQLASAAAAAEGEGIVHVLTNDNFNAATAEGDWLVKFYAPWCGHCKHIAPIYEEAAKALAGKMNFAEVDATQNSVLKSRFEITGYPTIKFLRKDTQPQDYHYPRTVEGFTAFTERMLAPPVQRLGTSSAVDKFIRDPEHPVSFIFALPEDGAAAQSEHAIFKEVAASLQSSQYFAETRVPEWVNKFEGHEAPFVVKAEHGEEPVVLDSILSVSDLTAWVEDNRFQVLSEVTSMNFRDLSSSGRLLAIGVVDPASSGTKKFLATLRTLARPAESPLSPTVRSSFHFCYLDGVRWEKFVNQFNVKVEQLPRLFVLDGENKKFFEDVEVDELDELETFLVDVVGGEVPAQREGIWGLPQRLWRQFMDYYPHSVIAAVAVLVAIAVGVLRGSSETAKAHEE